GIHVLHVDGAAAPEHAVFDHPGEGVDTPVIGDRGHDVEVAVYDEGTGVTLPPLDPCHDAHATRLGFEHLGVEAHRGESGGHIFGSLGLAVRLALAVVGRVYADEVPRDDRGFVEGGFGARLGRRQVHESTVSVNAGQVAGHRLRPVIGVAQSC